jgi:hypothetical protein
MEDASYDHKSEVGAPPRLDPPHGACGGPGGILYACVHGSGAPATGVAGGGGEAEGRGGEGTGAAAAGIGGRLAAHGLGRDG